MSWMTAFVSNWYSISYALSAVFSLGLAWWVWMRNLAVVPIPRHRSSARAVKWVVVTLLISLSIASLVGAYQVTAFEHYFAVKKMPPN
ncbi:hypothetical protein [Massilia antarctica]|uniref:hypothetical protein n=1 Tax=Massilia antarctica TaxID=2765360 RepID=UPI00227117DA|nr:hypothetical protein [Massilia sp. H27-R4]MCY0916544.1 hypothetical protein [Massilia sp. H27-R4]